MSGETWFITGTTRGIGRGLVQSLLQRPNTTIIAGVRDPSASAATALSSLPKASNSKLILVKINSLSETDPKAAVAKIQTEHGINHLDVVIANAGVADNTHASLLETPISLFKEMYEGNTLGPILLFQATEKLLSKAKNPRFFVSTSVLGSATITAGVPIPVAPYGASKNAVNYFLVRGHVEHPNITFVPIHPGLVATEMGTPFSEKTGIPSITVDESVKGYLKQIDNASRETSGKFIDWNGDAQPW